jgi:hypothetical protein
MRMDGAIDLFPTTTVNGRSLPLSAEAQGDCFECSRVLDCTKYGADESSL